MPLTKCLPRWAHLPFLLEEEETYSPPASEGARDAAEDGDDDDELLSEHDGSVSAASTYELGMAALQATLPRERLLDTMGAYARFRDELYAHLRPHADSGQVVTEASIREFFAQKNAERGERPPESF